MRDVRALALGTAVALASVLSPALARGAAPPVVPACANPALPHAILDGPVPEPSAPVPAPLPLVSVTGGAVPLTLAVAANESDRELGLMCVTRIAPHHGMIFAFREAAAQEFWMKNTLVPLDMVWVDATGKVTTVAERVPASTRETPDDRVARRLGYGAFVIELRSGEAGPDGLRPGVKLSLPKLEVTQ